MSQRFKILSSRVKILSSFRHYAANRSDRYVMPALDAGDWSTARGVHNQGSRTQRTEHSKFVLSANFFFRSINNTDRKLYASVGILFEQNESHVSLECSCTRITTTFIPK